jgi:hypothetical protein
MRERVKKLPIPDKVEVAIPGYLIWQFVGSNHVHIKETEGLKREYSMLSNGRELTKQNAKDFIKAIDLNREYRMDFEKKKGEGL